MDAKTNSDRATESDARVPWDSRTVQVVLASTALAPLGVPLISPTLPAFRDVFGITDARASLLVSSYFLVGIVLSPFIGILVDRLGRKRILVGGLLAFGVIGGGMAVAPTFETLLALRLVQGGAAAAIFITTVTLVGDEFDGVQRNAVLGVNVAVLSATAALFPVVVGALATVAWNAPFLTYLAAIPVALFALATLEEPQHDRTSRDTTHLTAATRTITTAPTLALFGVAFLTEFLLFGVLFTALPFLLAAALTPVVIGLVILASETASTIVAAANGKLARVTSNERLIAGGFACYAVGFAAIWFSSGLLSVVAAVTIVGVGVGLLMPAVDAAVSDLIPAEQLAGAMSLRNSTTFLGRTAGPFVFTGLAISGGYGYETLLLGASGIALVATGVAAVPQPRRFVQTMLVPERT